MRSTHPRRFNRSFRDRLVSYAAAIAINVELVTGQPTHRHRPSPIPITWTKQEPLIDGRWSRREVVLGKRSGVVVYEALASGVPDGEGGKPFSPN